MMAGDRLIIVLAFVAEEPSELVEQARVVDQPVPVVMANLVSEMTQECAVGLMHLKTSPFTLGVVSLRKVDRDHPIQMPSSDRGFIRSPGPGISEKIERQTPHRVISLARQGETETKQGVDHPPLGRLQFRPCLARAGLA